MLPVRLPGRESRRGEPAITSREHLLTELDRWLGPLLDRPYAFYGHSLGALVAYSFATHRAQNGHRPPELVSVGACSAPDLPTARLERGELSDAQLLAVLGDADGISPLLQERPRLLELMVATMREDLRLARSLRDGADLPLRTPLLCLAGRRDRLVTPEMIRGWQNWTTETSHLVMVDGNHFFVRDPEAPRAVSEALTALLPLPATS